MSNVKVALGVISAAVLGAGTGAAITLSVSNQRVSAVNEHLAMTQAEMSKVNRAHVHLVRSVLLSTLSEQLGKPISEIKDTDTLDSLDADSLDKLEVVLALEEAFTIDIVDIKAEKLTQSPVSFMVEYLSRREPRAEAQQQVPADVPASGPSALRQGRR